MTHDDAISPAKNLCVIPVRGGSKGVPRKNAAHLINGLSLLEWTIRQAQQSVLSPTTIVSTEDAELSRIAAACGVVVVQRPVALAQDDTTTARVVAHLLQTIDPNSDRFDAITILQVTSPLRQATDVNAAVTMLQDGAYDSVVSVHKHTGVHPAKLYLMTADGAVSAAADYETHRRQDLPPVYRRNGAIFMVKRRYFNQTGRLWGGKIGLVHMPQDRSIDIDTIADLQAARRFLRNQQPDKAAVDAHVL